MHTTDIPYVLFTSKRGEQNMMECQHYFQNNCNAPICQLDENSIKNGIWYADEEICRSRKYPKLLWLKNQKKIKKKTTNPEDGYFNVTMLNKNDNT